MTVRRLSEMEHYRTAGRRNDISNKSKAIALKCAALVSIQHSAVIFCLSLRPLLQVEQLQMTVDTPLPISPSDEWLNRSYSHNAVFFLIMLLSGGPISASRASSPRIPTSLLSEISGRGPRCPNLLPQNMVARTLMVTRQKNCVRRIRTC